MHAARVKGMTVPDGLLAPMRDSAALIGDAAALRARLAEDGYLLLRGVLDAGAVHEARAEVLGRLESVGEVIPGTDGVYSGRSQRAEREPDLGAFWKSVSEGKRFRSVSHGQAIADVVAAVAGEPVRAQDYVFLRVGVRGRSTGLHYDYPFFARLHDRVWTVWLPLGDVPIERGPLVVVENSHRFDDLIGEMRGFDVALHKERKADVGTDAIGFASRRGARLLSADFRAGDLALFGMYTLHGSLDHDEESGRVRISCDVRWQAAALPIDERYFGPDPRGTTGVGYGELNGAKPLDQPWHVR